MAGLQLERRLKPAMIASLNEKPDERQYRRAF